MRPVKRFRKQSRAARKNEGARGQRADPDDIALPRRDGTVEFVDGIRVELKRIEGAGITHVVYFG